MATAFNHIALNCEDPIAVERWYTKHFGFTRGRVYAPGPDQVVMIQAGGVYLELFKSTEELPTPKIQGAGQDYSGFRHFAFLPSLHVMKRLKGSCVVQENKSVIAERQHGRHIVAVLFVFRMVNDADGPMPAFFQEVVVRAGLVVPIASGRPHGRRDTRFRTIAPELHLQYSSSNRKRVRSTSAILLRTGATGARTNCCRSTATLSCGSSPRRARGSS